MTEYEEGSERPAGTAGSRQASLTGKERSDVRILIRFIEIYCGRVPLILRALDLKSIWKKDVLLCPECARVLKYGLTMRLRCPHNPKPMCKKCPALCYRDTYRVKIKEIMRFSCIYLVKHGRLDMLYHYLR